MKKMLILLLAVLLCLPCAFSLAEETGEAERPSTVEILNTPCWMH